jgi:ATP-dependent RNA helicase DeaD
MSQPARSLDVTRFSDLELDSRLLDGLTALGYEEPTPIQTAAIPPLLAGRDLLAQAATGTGKTAAFALPLLQRLEPSDTPSALILVPTRELAMQVSEAMRRYGAGIGVRVLAIYGGSPMSAQIRSLRRGVHVVVATPGRALDHLRRGTLNLDAVGIVVLDEADEMLDMGFAEDLESILSATPNGRQTALFSATMPPRITAIARKHLADPVTISLGGRSSGAGIADVRQVAYVVQRAHKLAALGRVLDVETPVSAIVFCRTRTDVDQLAEALGARGHRAEGLHGGLSQDQRDRVMQRFRARTTELLIATDVAARGLDVDHVSHVVNYDVPIAVEAYVHRIGRTGRAGRAGVAITLAEPRERRMLQMIERMTKQRIETPALPTGDDLRRKRQETARATLRETIQGGELDAWRTAAASLLDEFDPVDVVAAALKRIDPQTDRPDEPEIPTARPERPAPPQRERQDMGRLFIGGGRALRITPGDLVGAIANEAGLSGRSIGAIRIDERFSLVEVPSDEVDRVVTALRATTIKGKRLVVRPDQFRDQQRERQPVRRRYDRPDRTGG